MSKPTVLVVDDDPTSIEVMGQALRDIAEVSFASSGEDALAEVRAIAPELILLDVMMPGLDGIAVCEALKADPSTRDIPVVFVSAATDEAEESRGLLAGAIEYVAKPIRPALLAARVRNLLELKARRDRVALESPLDDLTGLASRRQLEETMATEWRRANRTGRPISLAIIAVDHVDHVAELFGASAVPDYLRRVAEALAGAAGHPNDLVTRFALDRFAALLPDTDEAGAASTAERMRAAVEALKLPAGHRPGGSITVSVGAATSHPAGAPTPIDLISQATSRLDEAARLGGNVSATAPLSRPRTLPRSVTTHPAELSDSGEGARLFIVDDDPICIEVLSSLAEQAGYEVYSALDALEALDEIDETKPDVVLLDVDMPNTDGFEICRRLKASGSTAGIPVIFLSGLTDAVEKVRAFAVGGADYLAKPFEAEEVLARIAHQVKIKRLQGEMRAANERLIELDKVKATFAAMLVHDVRSPLTVIQTTLGFLKDRTFADDPDLNELVAFSGEAMDKSLALIAEVLEIYRSDNTSRPRPLEVGDVTDVLRRCAIAARVEAKRRHVAIETRFDGPLWTRRDPARLERAINNLLGNALKFSHSGSRVVLEAHTETRGSETGVYIEVRDTGSGIPEAELPHLFELYHQADTQHRTAGVGLGLAIVKRIVDAHEGKVSVRSQLGVGTIFSIQLPGASPSDAFAKASSTADNHPATP